MTACRHCGEPLPQDNPSNGFCCHGCAAAHDLIEEWGLGRYYERRHLDPQARPPRPDPSDIRADYQSRIHRDADASGRERATLHLMVDGLQCAACVWLIETVLGRQPGVIRARLNMTTRRLTVTWDPTCNDADTLIAPVIALGYRLVPFDPALADDADQRAQAELLRAMAVAGFAAANVMLLSVSVWAGHSQGMEPQTRALMHWFSALIALPAIVYAGRPFFRSAWGALSHGRTNMDVPISLAVLLTGGISLLATFQQAPHAYFDSAIGLLFFLLVGRYLDRRARGRAHAAGSRLMVLGAGMAMVADGQGHHRLVPPDQVHPGERVLVAAGERIPVDGDVEDGRSTVDTSLMTGESLPRSVSPGDSVNAGTLNLDGPLHLIARASGEDTLLAQITRLMEAAEQGRARYVALADRVARWYAPVVHVLAVLAFLGWWAGVGLAWQSALLIAVSVLIITCPCALALAVPAVQVIAAGRLLRAGILMKTATALERLAQIDRVVFDKTGTLSVGQPRLLDPDACPGEALMQAAALAANSRHPLAKALCREAPPVTPARDVEEHPGLGLQCGDIRLGRRGWLGLADDGGEEMELWLARPGVPPVQFRFADTARVDAAQVIAALKAMNLPTGLLSGDRRASVEAMATQMHIDEWWAEQAPDAKVKTLSCLGGRPLMVGDGLNDAPALAAAHVSMSPATAADISQVTADLVFQGDRLGPVLTAIATARMADRLVKQNFALALGYNLITIPLALAGQVTPLIAAVAMSSSSLVVIANAMRLAAGRQR